jgi:hypothetical protein
MGRRAALLLLLFFLSLNQQAQTDSVYYGRDTNSTKKPPRPKSWEKDLLHKMTVGGNFQVWFGNPSFVFLSPTVGYRLTDQLNVGLGFIYNYTSVNYGSAGKFSQSIFGAHSYVRYIIAQSYFVQAQYDKLNQPDWYSPIPNDKVWIDYLLVGGGFRQAIGTKAALMTSLMYNLTPHPYSIYPGRVIIQFGFVTNL